MTWAGGEACCWCESSPTGFGGDDDEPIAASDSSDLFCVGVLAVWTFLTTGLVDTGFFVVFFLIRENYEVNLRLNNFIILTQKKQQNKKISSQKQ